MRIWTLSLATHRLLRDVLLGMLCKAGIRASWLGWTNRLQALQSLLILMERPFSFFFSDFFIAVLLCVTLFAPCFCS